MAEEFFKEEPEEGGDDDESAQNKNENISEKENIITETNASRNESSTDQLANPVEVSNPVNPSEEASNPVNSSENSTQTSKPVTEDSPDLNEDQEFFELPDLSGKIFETKFGFFLYTQQVSYFIATNF